MSPENLFIYFARFAFIFREKSGTPVILLTYKGMQVSIWRDLQPLCVSCFTQSTILVPEKYSNYFNARCHFFGSRRAYFRFVVGQILPQLFHFSSELNLRRVPKWKTYYQAQGQVLLRKNFVPLPDDWEALRHAAVASGVSMCFLFVFLMEIEMSGRLTQKKESNKFEHWNSDHFIPDFLKFPHKSAKLSRYLVKNLKYLVRYLKR